MCVCVCVCVNVSMYVCACTLTLKVLQNNNTTSGKNYFHEMNGDVGMAGWK